MTRIKTKLAGIAFGLGLTLSLVAIPVLAGAAGNGALMIQYPQHPAFSPVEAAQQTQNEGVADYAIVELTELEQIAGRDNLDSETIRFLEANLYLPSSRAGYAMDDLTELERIAGRRNLDAETIKFLEENLWDYDVLAEYQGPIEPSPKREVVVDEMNGY